MKSMQWNRQNLRYFLDSVLNSYSQVFFSVHRPYSILLLFVTFYDIYAGLSGLIAVLTTSLAAFLLKLDKPTISKGYFGFNSLLVGLGLGIYFSFGIHLFMILILASLFTFFISVSMQGVIGKYHLPYLSIPFLLSIWVFITATRSFEALNISERGIYTLNQLYHVGGSRLVSLHEYFNNIQIPDLLRTYFISLSAILFQYSVLTGMVITLGLLMYSRIAFSLSVIGFSIAYLFYGVIGASISDVDYSYIGFNYILTAIALGGFFIIPSIRSYLWVILLIPLVAILTISLGDLFIAFKLPVYSLPFNIVVLLFIYSLKFRPEFDPKLAEAYYQYNSPERNLYIFNNNSERFRYKFYRPIKLPFFGIWNVSQGHNGAYTHKGEWRYAWDFVILDKQGKQFKNNGDYPEDYYCYGKPIVAPDEGIIERVVDGIEDNIIGEVDLKNNWGNTVIIKHDDGVYTKLSHLKKGSIQAKEGEKVKYGQVLATCGNSGRSPYPHLHFQIQENPYIGSTTLDYPISNFIRHQGSDFQFRSNERPSLNDTISNIESNELLQRAYDFIPGDTLDFRIEGYPGVDQVQWEIKVNELNETYIRCDRTGAVAYFEKDENQFMFTYFEGSKTCLLFYFFLSNYRLQEGFYQGLELKDQYPLSLVYPKRILWFHDFISPFIRVISSNYSLTYKSIDDYLAPSSISLESSMINRFGKRSINRIEFTTSIGVSGIESIEVRTAGQTIKILRCKEC